METTELPRGIRTFLAAVDKYVAQRERRGKQTPWLIVSFAAFFAGFVGLGWLTIDGGAWAWALAAVAVVVCIWSMALAGRQSEDDPPKDGYADIRAALLAYEPTNKAAYDLLLALFDSNRWRLADLIAFLNAEIRLHHEQIGSWTVNGANRSES